MFNIIKVEDDETLTTATVPAIRVITTGGDGWNDFIYSNLSKTGAAQEVKMKTSFVIFRGNKAFEALWELSKDSVVVKIGGEKAAEDMQGLLLQAVGTLVFEELSKKAFRIDGRLRIGSEKEGPFYYVGSWTRAKP